MQDKVEDVNCFKVLPWWKKIIIFLIGFGIAVFFSRARPIWANERK